MSCSINVSYAPNEIPTFVTWGLSKCTSCQVENTVLNYFPGAFLHVQSKCFHENVDVRHWKQNKKRNEERHCQTTWLLKDIHTVFFKNQDLTNKTFSFPLELHMLKTFKVLWIKANISINSNYKAINYIFTRPQKR